MRSFSLFRELSYKKTDIILICLVVTNIYCLNYINNTAILSHFKLFKHKQTTFSSMAERYAADEAYLVIHPTKASIHEHFNNIIYRLNQRKEEMIYEFRERMEERIYEFRERMEERRVATTTRLKTVQQLIDSKADLQSHMKENLLHSMREKMLEDIDTKMAQLQVVKETQVVFECDTQQLEQTISVLGQLI